MAHEENNQRDPEMNPEWSEAYREGEPPAGPPGGEPPAELSAAEATEPELTAGQWLTRNAGILIVSAALLIFLYTRFGVTGLISIGLVAVGLGFVIFIHELGHFLVAKWCGVKVEVFSIGFGPALPGCRFQWGETNYKLALFPLGGYVQMLGQVDLQEEDDGTEEDPRSYKNKAVWQRMAIISAGVVMNALLALVLFFLVFLGPGKERFASVAGGVDSQSPSFVEGIPTGAVIEEVGGVADPYFQNVIREVLVAHIFDQDLNIAYREPGEKRHEIQMRPRLDEGNQAKIGIVFPWRAQLLQSRLAPEGLTTPTKLGSAAGKASPALAFDDWIIATTDPDNPDEIKELPIDPRVPEGDPNYGQRDFYEFQRRMQKLAGQEIVLRVERESNNRTKETVDVRIAPEYHRSLGAVMAMGEITAVRNNSPADMAGVQQQDKRKKHKGDLIEMVEVKEPDGKITRFSYLPEKDKENERHEKWLDPVRLPSELKEWAKRMAQAKEDQQDWTVTLHVKRHNPPKETPKEYTRKTMELEWDRKWEFDMVHPLSPDAPMPIAELGLAYQIKSTVIAVDPDVAGEGLQAGDIIEQIQFHQLGDDDEQEIAGKWHDLTDKSSDNQADRSNSWAHIAYSMHSPGITKISLKIKRNGESEELTLVPQEVKDWPQADRGLIFMRDMRQQKAGNLVEAMTMGFDETRDRLMDVIITLRGLVSRRVPTDSVGGPLAIVTIAYHQASVDFWDFVFFIAFISINLAVINFLPIPILDGGHMVFLLYELVRGKPASENVRVWATYAGLLFIVGLFVFVMYVDIARFIRGFP